MIEARGLTKRYGEKLAVDNLSFTVRPGVVTGFLGPNGAGKSTTIRMILGLDAPTAIRAVASGDAVVAPSVTRRLLDAFLPHLPDPASPSGDSRETPELRALTSREREILLQVAAGLSNAEIAARLVLAEATVKTHVGRMLTKLHLRDRVQAVVFAYEHGLVRPGTGQ